MMVQYPRYHGRFSYEASAPMRYAPQIYPNANQQPSTMNRARSDSSQIDQFRSAMPDYNGPVQYVQHGVYNW